MLGEFEARLSDVPRWGIVRTVQKQSVAEHSFRVALMAPRVAVDYLGVSKADFETLFLISRYALLHDQWEAFTGDIPTPAKPGYDMGYVYHHYGDRIIEKTVYSLLNLPVVTDAVKIADIMESVIFLGHEMMMGNHSVQSLYRKLLDDLTAVMIKCGLCDADRDDIMLHVDGHGRDQDPL
jgi:hypothetical protein